MSHTATCDLYEHVHKGVEPPGYDHGHSHGIIDPAITRSKAGIRAVSISLAVLTVTAVAQTLIYALTLSVVPRLSGRSCASSTRTRSRTYGGSPRQA
jgi:hypothetical protein